MGAPTFPEKVDFILKLGTALHKYGAPAERLEQALSSVSAQLGVESQIFSTPTAIMATLQEGEREVTRIIRIQPGEVDLGKLSYVDNLGDTAIAGKASLQDCSEKIEAILRRKALYPATFIVLSHGFSSLGIACIFQAGYADLLWSFLVGMLIGILRLLAKKYERAQRVFEAAAAVLAAIIAELAAYKNPSVSVPTVILAGLINLMPGLTLTIALTELATQNLIAGTARLMGSAITLFKLLTGVILGTTFVSLFLEIPAHSNESVIPTTFMWLGLALTSLAAIVIYKADAKDRIWVVLASCAGFLSAKIGAIILGANLGVFCGGFVIGAGSNLFARLLKRPASIIVVPGIVLLVPGSLGYRSLTYMVQNDILKGVDSAFRVFLIAATIVAGLLFGNMFISPKRSL